MPIPRPLRTHKMSSRYESFLSRLDNPVELYLRTLLLNENPRDSGMEYYNLYPTSSTREQNRSRNTDCNCNKVRPQSTVSVRASWRGDGFRRMYMGGFYEEELGWPFLPWKLQKLQIYICRHLKVMWKMFMTNFKDEDSEGGRTNSFGEDLFGYDGGIKFSVTA